MIKQLVCSVFLTSPSRVSDLNGQQIVALVVQTFLVWDLYITTVVLVHTGLVGRQVAFSVCPLIRLAEFLGFNGWKKIERCWKTRQEKKNLTSLSNTAIHPFGCFHVFMASLWLCFEDIMDAWP